MNDHRRIVQSKNWSRSKAKRRYMKMYRWARHYFDDEDVTLTPVFDRVWNSFAVADTRAQLRRPPAEASSILYRAADLIDKYGWCKGDAGSKRNGFCVVGAIEYVAGVYTPAFDWSYNARKRIMDVDQRAINALWDRIGRTTPLSYWNDNVIQDAETVTRTLREVAGVCQINGD